jgi:hypothetical protein
MLLKKGLLAVNIDVIANKRIKSIYVILVTVHVLPRRIYKKKGGRENRLLIPHYLDRRVV